MANYFVIGNTFRPYSFDELIKPYQIYGQAYKEQEAALDTLSSQEPSDVLPEGSKAQAMYNQANINLQGVSDRLLTEGLNPSLRSDIRKASKEYSSTINTINNAQKALNSERERRLKLGEDYVYQDNDLSIDRFLSGETVNPKQASLSNITKTVAAEVGQLAQNIVSAPEFSMAKNSSGQYWQIAQDYGLDNADMIYLTSRDANGKYLWETDPGLSSTAREALKDKYNAFVQAAENKRTQIDYDNYATPEKNRIDAAINEGMYAALGQAKYSTQANRGYETPAEAAKRQRDEQLFQFQYDIVDGQIKGLTDAYKQATTDQATAKAAATASSRGTGSGGSGVKDDIGAQTSNVRLSLGSNPEKTFKTVQEAFDAVNKGLSRRGKKSLTLSDNVPVEDLSKEGKIRALHNINVSTSGLTEEQIDNYINVYKNELDTYLYYESKDEKSPTNDVFISVNRDIKTKMPTPNWNITAPNIGYTPEVDDDIILEG